MGLSRGTEVLFDPDVDLLRPARKPEAAADGEGRGLRELGEAEELTEEPASLGLASAWSGELDVIDSLERVVCLGCHHREV